MLSIWKFPLQRPMYTFGQIFVKVPRGARLLSAMEQRGEIVVYAIVEPDQPPEDRALVIVGTGKPVSADTLAGSFLGTIAQGSFVWHVFEPRTDVALDDAARQGLA